MRKPLSDSRASASLRSLGDSVEELRKAIRELGSPAAASPAGEALEDQIQSPRAPTRAQELMDWLRADMSGRYFGQPSVPYIELAPVPHVDREAPDAGRLERPAIAWPEVTRKEGYALDELMGFHDEAFVRNGYLALLRREPTAAEIHMWVDPLLAGQLSRQEVLAAIRYSEEGRRVGVHVRGLRVAAFVRQLRRVPLLWRLVGIAQYIVQLPVLARNLERLDASVHRVAWRAANDRADLVHEIGEAARRRDNELARLRHDVAALADRVAAIRASDLALRTWLGGFGEKLVALHKSATELMQHRASQATRAEMAAIAQRMLGTVEGLRESVALLESEKAGVAAVEEGVRLATQRLEAARDGLASRLSASHQALEGRLAAAQEEIGQRLGAAQEEMRQRFGAAQAEAGRRLAEVQDALGKQVGAAREAIGTLERTRATIESVENSFREASERVASIEDAVELLDSRKAAMEHVEEGARRAEQQIGELRRALLQIDATVFDTRSLDAFYVGLEGRFRGTREDIRGRLEVYLPVVKAALEATGAPLLDVGCGRGEWLELLRDQGLAARGVDTNGEMVRLCREMGLEVAEGDALEYLRAAKTGEFGAVNGIHIIEHVPFKYLLALFDEAFRVLAPGGVVVFETPNPENVLVGTCNFWFDPTHVKPLPPEMMRYVAQAQGFERVEIARLHPYSGTEHLPDAADKELRDRLNHLFHGPQDYAVIAFKPGAAADGVGQRARRGVIPARPGAGRHRPSSP